MPTTANFAMELPIVGGDVDDWGDKLNDNLNIIDKHLVPTGCILMWSGSVASIPATWALCDGTNGTPDLRDRFIVGAGSTYAVAANGGAATVALAEAELPAHTHSDGTLTTASDGAHSHTASSDTQGSHSHTYTRRTNNQFVSISGSVTVGFIGVNGEPVPTLNTSVDGAHNHNITVHSGGNHTHDITGATGSTGSGTAHENRPPYYALAYIMKLAA